MLANSQDSATADAEDEDQQLGEIYDLDNEEDLERFMNDMEEIYKDENIPPDETSKDPD